MKNFECILVSSSMLEVGVDAITFSAENCVFTHIKLHIIVWTLSFWEESKNCRALLQPLK